MHVGSMVYTLTTRFYHFWIAVQPSIPGTEIFVGFQRVFFTFWWFIPSGNKKNNHSKDLGETPLSEAAGTFGLTTWETWKKQNDKESVVDCDVGGGGFWCVHVCSWWDFATLPEGLGIRFWWDFLMGVVLNCICKSNWLGLLEDHQV